MSELTRRAFLKQGGATAAAAGAAVAVPKGLMSNARPQRRDRPARQTSTAATAKSKAARQLVVHVPDARKSELRLMFGEREVVLQDRDLVARLVRETR